MTIIKEYLARLEKTAEKLIPTSIREKNYPLPNALMAFLGTKTTPYYEEYQKGNFDPEVSECIEQFNPSAFPTWISEYRHPEQQNKIRKAAIFAAMQGRIDPHLTMAICLHSGIIEETSDDHTIEHTSELNQEFMAFLSKYLRQINKQSILKLPIQFGTEENTTVLEEIDDKKNVKPESPHKVHITNDSQKTGIYLYKTTDEHPRWVAKIITAQGHEECFNLPKGSEAYKLIEAEKHRYPFNAWLDGHIKRVIASQKKYDEDPTLIHSLEQLRQQFPWCGHTMRVTNQNKQLVSDDFIQATEGDYACFNNVFVFPSLFIWNFLRTCVFGSEEAAFLFPRLGSVTRSSMMMASAQNTRLTSLYGCTNKEKVRSAHSEYVQGAIEMLLHDVFHQDAYNEKTFWLHRKKVFELLFILRNSMHQLFEEGQCKIVEKDGTEITKWPSQIMFPGRSMPYNIWGLIEFPFPGKSDFQNDSFLREFKRSIGAFLNILSDVYLLLILIHLKKNKTGFIASDQVSYDEFSSEYKVTCQKLDEIWEKIHKEPLFIQALVMHRYSESEINSNGVEEAISTIKREALAGGHRFFLLGRKRPENERYSDYLDADDLDSGKKLQL
ncbi:MAG: hypothetical protein A3E85_04525 [Gammaproteobacteria bacterium RIFCSPHIGHO2_12_FULL_45_12]|nr:MAG: hypothetical protein A3E85_04525 [Gammaproteobacteria bacterium RIFCSPHIGHO2_12_FULL_45_12]